MRGSRRRCPRRSASCCRRPIYARINSQLGHYLGVFAVSAGLVGADARPDLSADIGRRSTVDDLQLSDVLWKVFFALTIIIGVVAWLFVLAQQSRRAAEAETRRQTTLLIQEIDAHKRTDAELQRAKEVAESANLAKSRYVVGLSHELRSPLNAISGYAQLLEQDASLQHKAARSGARGPPQRRSSVRADRRHSRHLQDRGGPALSVARRGSPRANFLDQLVGMFRLQAAAKGIDFVFKRPAVLPVVVYADEKRLRQILINLLSNAIKFTQSGSVQFVVHYRSPVAEFEVIDTGPGIQADDLERIFAPFERGALGVSQPQTGTGLGLTISRLLAGVMGGDIKVTSDGRHRQHVSRQDAAVGSHQSDAHRADRCADLRLSRPAQDHPDHRRRSDPSRSAARGAGAARLHPAQRAGRHRPAWRWRSIAGPICSCSIFPWPAWTAGRWRRRCARPAITRRAS